MKCFIDRVLFHFERGEAIFRREQLRQVVQSVREDPKTCREPAKMFQCEKCMVSRAISNGEWRIRSPSEAPDFMKQSGIGRIEERSPSLQPPIHKVSVINISEIAGIHKPNFLEKLGTN